LSKLATALGSTPEAVTQRLNELAKLGYLVESDPHQGCRLVRTPNALHADDLYARIGKVQTIGRDIRVFSETTSTNDVAERLATDGVEEGVVVFAESQTRGRGRLGRTWVSTPRTGLWFSILLRPRLTPQAVTRLTIGAATSLARAIEKQLGIAPEIKWPNDLLLNGKKIVGILTEMNAELDSVRHVILGVGINVNQTGNDFPDDLKPIATSLRLHTGGEIDRPALAAAALRELDTDYGKILNGEFASVSEEWAERCATVGQSVSIRMGDRLITGRCESLDPDGALLVRTEHGHLERVTGGDVTVLKE